jgi:hypothetical protein
MKINPDTKKPYNIVFNKADQKTTNDLYVEKTPEGKFTPKFDTEIGEKQADQLRGFLKGQLRIKYDRKVEMNPYNEPQKQRIQPVYDPGARGAAAYQQKIKMYHKLFVGSPGEMNLALQNVKSSSAVDPSQTLYDANTKKLIITPKDPLAPPIIYDFKNPDPNVSMQDLVFSLLDLVDPQSNSKYGGEISKYNFGNVTPSTNMPYDDLIRESKDRYVGHLDDAKKHSVGSKERKYYMGKATAEKRVLDDLEKKQAAQRQGQSTGKAPRP